MRASLQQQEEAGDAHDAFGYVLPLAALSGPTAHGERAGDLAATAADPFFCKALCVKCLPLPLAHFFSATAADLCLWEGLVPDRCGSAFTTTTLP